MTQVTAMPAPVAIDSLVDRADQRHALKRWNSFVPVRPAETSAKARPAVLVNAGENAAWYHHVHDEVAEVSEVGVSLLDHVTLSGPYYGFRGGRMLTDDSVPSQIAQRFAAAEGLSAELLIHRERPLIFDPPALVIGGPGYQHWGHWLLDFLPRLGLARAALGAEFDRFVLPIPSDAPSWLPAALGFFGAVEPHRVFRYDATRESLFCSRVAIPSVPHSRYFLHSYLREFYQGFVPAQTEPSLKRLFISRRGLPDASHVFAQAAYAEARAAQRGYTVICPEQLPLTEQIALYGQAEVIVGSCGSGMHNAIFAPSGCVVGQIGMPNAQQSRIAALCDHRMVYLFPDDPNPASGVMSVGEAEVDAFFHALDEARQAALISS